MPNDLKDVQREQRMKESQNKNFAEWMSKPETKLMLSMVPPVENPDVLQTLLRGAFDAGHNSGQGNILVEMLTGMLTRAEPPKF